MIKPSCYKFSTSDLNTADKLKKEFVLTGMEDLMVMCPNKPNALVYLLEKLKIHNIDLTRIQSALCDKKESS